MKLTLDENVTRPAPVDSERHQVTSASTCTAEVGVHTFRILEVWVTVDASVADIAIPGVEDVGQFTCLQGPGNSSNENGLASIYWLGMVHDVVTVIQPPRSDLHLCG